MSFWSKEFMNDRRKQWLAALVKFQFCVDSTWYDATINTKRIVGCDRKAVRLPGNESR